MKKLLKRIILVSENNPLMLNYILNNMYLLGETEDSERIEFAGLIHEILEHNSFKQTDF